MSLRNLRILALSILALSISAYTQSLGDLARQVRAERARRGASHAKVFTNDDIASHEANVARPAKADNDAAQDAPANEGQPTTQTGSSKEDEKKGASAKLDDLKTGDKSKKTLTEREERELETQKRTQEINQVYLDRIAGLRKQLKTAQFELAKLQQAQADNTADFRRTVGLSPFPSEYAQQQYTFNEQIEAQRNSINSLNSQVEDAQEAARHAGVPHATD
jgi:hypothetical protein